MSFYPHKSHISLRLRSGQALRLRSGQALLILHFSFLILCSCQRPTPAPSELFLQLFGDQTRMYRNVELRMPRAEIRSAEPQPPKHEDLLGLSYEYDLSGEKKLFVEYYTGQPTAGLAGDTVTSIVSNVLLHDPIEAAALYQEIHQHFTQTYGLALGRYGDDVWQGELPTGKIAIHLKLDDQLHAVTLNFIDQ